MKSWKLVTVTTLGILVLSVPAIAQTQQVPAGATAQQATTKGTWNGLPDRFQVDAGYFRLNAATELRFQGSIGGGTDVSFEKDLGVGGLANTYWIDATVRMSSRNYFKISYISITRDGPTTTLKRDFTWNDEVYSAGLSASASVGWDVISTYYRLAIVKTNRVDAGLSTGLGYLKLRAAIAATGTLTMPGGQVNSVNLDESGSLGAPTGGIGGFVTVWPAKRVMLTADYMYIAVNIADWGAHVKDWRVAVNWYPWRHAGIGAQYKFNEFGYDMSVDEGALGGTLRYQGPQIYASFRF